MLRDRPGHLAPLSATHKAAAAKMARSYERAKQQILKAFKYGAITPDRHAYEMASVGDEALEGHETAILQRDSDYLAREAMVRTKGHQKRSTNTQNRAELACTYFAGTLARTRPLGHLSLSAAAGYMRLRWPSDGSLGEKPTAQTLCNWIKRASPYPGHKLMKTMRKKKSSP